MDFSTIIPILDSLSQLAEKTPIPYVALAGAVLAGVVVILKKLQNAKVGAPEVVVAPKPVAMDALGAPEAKKEAEAIAEKTLK